MLRRDGENKVLHVIPFLLLAKTRTATGDREIRSVSGRVGMSALISSP